MEVLSISRKSRFPKEGGIGGRGDVSHIGLPLIPRFIKYKYVLRRTIQKNKHKISLPLPYVVNLSIYLSFYIIFT